MIRIYDFFNKHYLLQRQRSQFKRILSTHSPLMVRFELNFSDPISYRNVPNTVKERIIFVPNKILLEHNYETDVELYNRILINILDCSIPKYYSINDLCDCSHLQIQLGTVEDNNISFVHHKYIVNEQHLLKDVRISRLHLSNACIGVYGAKLLTLQNFKISAIQNLKLSPELKFFVYNHKEISMQPDSITPESAINYRGYCAS